MEFSFFLGFLFLIETVASANVVDNGGNSAFNYDKYLQLDNYLKDKVNFGGREKTSESDAFYFENDAQMGNFRTKVEFVSCKAYAKQDKDLINSYKAYDDWCFKKHIPKDRCTCEEVINIYKFTKNIKPLQLTELIDEFYDTMCTGYRQVGEDFKRQSAFLESLEEHDSTVIKHLFDHGKELVSEHLRGRAVGPKKWPIKSTLEGIKTLMNKTPAKLEEVKRSLRGKYRSEELINSQVAEISRQYFSFVYSAMKFSIEFGLDQVVYKQIVSGAKVNREQSVLKSHVLDALSNNEEAVDYIKKDVKRFPTLLNSIIFLFYDSFYLKDDEDYVKQIVNKFVEEFFQIAHKKHDWNIELTSKALKIFCGISLKKFDDYLNNGYSSKKKILKGYVEEDDDDDDNDEAEEDDVHSYIGFLADFKDLNSYSSLLKYVEQHEKDTLFTLKLKAKARPLSTRDALNCL